MNETKQILPLGVNTKGQDFFVGNSMKIKIYKKSIRTSYGIHTVVIE